MGYKVTTKRKHSDAVADNSLNQNFNWVVPNQIWAGDVTHITVEMDLYSRRIVGWYIEQYMTTDLVMIKAYNLKKPAKGLVFHSDRGFQYQWPKRSVVLQDWL